MTKAFAVRSRAIKHAVMAVFGDREEAEAYAAKRDPAIGAYVSPCRASEDRGGVIIFVPAVEGQVMP